MPKILQAPLQADRELWFRVASAVALFALCIVLLFFAHRLAGLYWLYWGNESFKRLFFDDIGLGEAWSSALGAVLAFVYALALIHLFGASTWRLLQGKANPQQLVLSFACYFVAFALPPLIHGVASTWVVPDQCFNQRTGEPIKWYVVLSGGEVVLYDQDGFDKFGVKKQPATKEVCEIFHRQRSGVRPHKISTDPRRIEFFDPTTGRPKVWYSQTTETTNFFDATGFDPITSEPLLPVTPEISSAARMRAEKINAVEAPAVKLLPPNSSPNSNTIITGSTPVPQPQQAAATTESFDLRICNQTGAPASVAVMGRELSTERSWILKGWMKIVPGECKGGGRYFKGDLFVTANGPVKTIGAPKTTLCVSNAPFRKVHNSSGQCLPGERLQIFERIAIQNSAWTWNLDSLR